ncbi:MAG: RHS repeat protein, partial [Phycisphaerales bacterium]|nr:RHS repeat protein [Phycisphaerales bacterium]
MPQTSLSGQTPLSSARLNSREGAAVGGNTLGLWLEADPSASSLEAMRSIGPVDLFTGKVEWRDVQIALPAHVPWVVGVAYSNAQSAAGGSNGPQGWNWQQLSQPELVRRQANAGQWGAGDAILLVYGGRYAEYWRQNALNPVLVGVNGTGGGIRLWTATTSGGSYEMVDVLDTKGWKATFWGWGNVPAGLRGQLWRIENEGGQRAYVGHPTDPGLAAAQGFNASGLLATAYDSAGRRYTYSYTVGAVGGRVRLSSVVAAAQSGGQWVEVQRAEYRYWGNSEFAWGGSTVPAERGADGDLALIRVVTPLSVAGTSLTTRQHFRYWLGNEGAGAGAAHDLRLIVAEEGARQAASAGVSLTAGSLQQVRRFAQSTMAYSGGRVSVLGVPVTATVAGTVPEMTLGYDTGAGQWARRTRITYPATGGADPLRLEHQMFDGWGGPLSRAVLAAAPSTPSVITGKWVTAVVRDSGGMVQSVGSPASVAAYDEATGVVTLATNQGLVRTVDRVPSGGAAGVPAAAAGLVSGTWAQQGHQMTSSPTRQQETAQTWSIRSVGDGVTSPVLMRACVSSSSVYRDTQPGNRGVGSTTEFAWAFEPGKLTPRSVVTTDPAVSVERNGRGTPFTRTQHYFANGLPSVSVSEAGRLVSNEYDAATGQLTRSLFDALVADVPAGAIASGVTLTDWPIANAGPALRRETRYVYDAVGRISVVQHPGRRFTAAWPGGIREMSQTVYSKIANETLLVIDVPMVLGTPASPTGWRGVADVRTVNHAGVTIASGTVATGPRGPAWHAQNATTQSPTTWAVSGASDLAAAFPAASGRPLLSYTRATTWSHSGQIPTQWQSRVNATGSAWLTSGIEFDVLGRLRASTGPDGTRTELRLDARGLVTSVYRGFTSPGQAVSRMIAEFAYDNEGRLTSRTVRPRPDEPLLMELRYNWKGDLLAQINPTEPHLLMAYNGIGQLTGQALVGGPGAALLAALPNYNGRDLLAMALPLGPRRETLLDELGRPYREKQFGKRDGACTEAPASPGIDSVTPMVTDHWRGAHGNVTMSAGETVTRTGYDRACGVQQINVIATTTTAPAGQQPISYQNATGGVNANDNVLQTTYFARNRTNGEVVGLAMAVRDSRQFDGDANFRGPLIIDNPFKYGPTGISPVPTGIQIPSNPGNVHPEMLLRMTFPDEFGRPQIERDYGRQPKPGDPELCCGIDCGLPPIGIEPPREQRREYRDDLKWYKLIKPDGSIDSFYFDDLGRTVRHCEEPWGIYRGPSMPAKIPGMPEVPGCNKKQTETKWEYEDARLRRIIRSDCSNPSETGGPSTILENFFPTDGLIAPGGMVFTPPTNASAVIAIRQGDMGMYYRDLDEMGRPRQMLDPRNVLRTLRYAVGGVPTGRLEGITISQPQGQIGQFGPAEMFIKPTYDIFGALEGVEQRAGENGCLLDKISTPTGVLGQPCKTITCLGMSCGTTPSGCGSTDPNAPGPQGLRLSQTTNFEYAAFGLNGGVIGGAGAGQWGGIRETRRTLPGGGGLGMYHPGFGPGTGSGWQTALNTGTGRLEALILEPGGSSVHPTNPVFRQGYLGIWKPRWTDLPDIQGVWWHHLPSKTPDGPVTPMFYRPKDEFGQPSNERFEIYRDDIPKFDPPPEQDLPPPPLIWSSIEYARGANGVLTDKAVQIREPRMSFFEASPDLPATDWVKDRYFD